MVKKPFLYYFIIAFLSVTAFLKPADSRAQRPVLTHLGVEDGLANNYVNSMAQDAKGCLWIATENGLSCFNGYTFINFRSTNSPIVNDALRKIYYDRHENRLWICGLFNGVYALDCFTFQFQYYTQAGGKNLTNVVDIKPAADGGIWLVPKGKSLCHYNPVSHRFTTLDLPGLSEYDKFSILDDGKGYLYIGNSYKGLDIVDLHTKRVRNFRPVPGNDRSLPGNRVYDITMDNNGRLWLATNSGLALFHPDTETFTTFRHRAGDPESLISDHVYDISVMRDGKLWIASDIGGISILDTRTLPAVIPAGIQFRNILPDNEPGSLSSGNIRSLLQDRAGNIWAGNYSSGLNFIPHEYPPFSLLPYMTAGAYPRYKPVWGLCMDSEGNLWAGGENEVCLFRNNSLVKTISITGALSRSYVQVHDIIEDRKGRMLFGLYDDGVLEYDVATGKVSRIPMDHSNIDVFTFYKDKDNSILIGTEYGLYHYRDGRVWKEQGLTGHLADISIYDILRDRQGKLWISTFYGGVSVIAPDGRSAVQLNDGTGFKSNTAPALTMDDKGRIWIGTRKGIACVPDSRQPQKYIFYDYTNGLPDNQVQTVTEDAEGNIWLSTSNGISRYNRKEGKFENYNYLNGLPKENFIAGAVARDRKGTLYFGSLGGICYFRPDRLLTDRKMLPVQITWCRGLGGEIEEGNENYTIPVTEDGIDLPYNRNSFQLSFAVPDYALIRQVEYAYRIKGLDDKWISTDNENNLTFRNLPPGDYTFEVKARLKNQAWDEAHIAEVDIHIRPPFWWTWYARLFYIAVIAGGIVYWLHIWKRRLKLESDLEVERRKNENEQILNKERMQFYTNITHELRTPLTLILGPLDDLYKDTRLPEGLRPGIKLICNSAQRLLDLVNRLLDFRKAESYNRQLSVIKGDLGNLITETGLRYKELNRNRQVTITVSLSPDIHTPVFYDPEVISTIVNNLMSNALKYTPAGTIELSMQPVVVKETPYMEIRVKDTGYGIPGEALPHIFDRYYQAGGTHQAEGTGIGLSLVKALVELHQGQLEVESEEGKGSVFIVRLQSEATYPSAIHRETTATEGRTEHPDADSHEAEDGTTGKIILVVEDNDDIRNYIAASFDHSFKIITAANGQEGWLKAGKYIPDLIISDIMMPVMDGIALCRKVKEDVRTSHIPVILLTAKDSITDKEEGYDSGADSYLTKPFSARLLLIRVRNLLESRKKLAELTAARTTGKTGRTAGETDSADGGETLDKVSQAFLERFIDIVEKNINKSGMDTPYIAGELNMSHSTLYRKIKSITGGSCNEYIRKIKLRHAVRLIKEQHLNVSEAAYASGFNDIDYFRKCFKKEYGILPSELIK